MKKLFSFLFLFGLIVTSAFADDTKFNPFTKKIDYVGSSIAVGSTTVTGGDPCAVLFIKDDNTLGANALDFCWDDTNKTLTTRMSSTQNSFEILDADDNPAFLIRKGLLASESYPQMLLGKLTPNLSDILDSVDANIEIITGNGPSFLLNSIDIASTNSQLAGFDSGQQILQGVIFQTFQVFGLGDSTSLNFFPYIYVTADDDWTDLSTPVNLFFLTTRTGEITPFIRLRISANDGVIVNDSSESDGYLTVKSPVSDFFVYADTSNSRFSMFSSNASAQFDLHQPNFSEPIFQIQPDNFNHSADLMRVLNSDGDNVHLLKFNGASLNNEDITFSTGKPIARLESSLSIIPGNSQISYSEDNMSLIAAAAGNFGDSMIGGGVDSGTVPTANQILTDFITFGNDNTNSISYSSVVRVKADANWSGGDAPTALYLMSTPDGSNSPVEHYKLSENGTSTFNLGSLSNSDFIVNGANVDMIHADASSNEVGINTVPDSSLHVHPLFSEDAVKVETNVGYNSRIFSWENSGGDFGYSLSHTSSGGATDVTQLLGKPSSRLTTYTSAFSGSQQTVSGELGNTFVASTFTGIGSGIYAGSDSGSVQNATTNPNLAFLGLFGNDTTSSVKGETYLETRATGTWSGTSTPYKIVMRTVPSATTSGLDRFEINSDGSFVLNKSQSSTGNVSFDASGGVYLFGDPANRRVGIKDTAPDFPLDINGNMRIQDTNNIYFGNSANNNQKAYINLTSNSTPVLELGGINSLNNLSLDFDFDYKAGSGVTNQVGIYSGDATDIVFATRSGYKTSSNSPFVAIFGGNLRSSTTAVGNVGTGEDTLISFNYDMNTLGVNGDYIDIESWITFATNANSKRVKLYFGSEVIYDSTAQIQNGGVMRIKARVIRISGGSQICMATSDTNATLFNSGEAQYTTTSQDLTTTFTIKTTGEAVNNNDVYNVYLMDSYGSGGNVQTAA